MKRLFLVTITLLILTGMALAEAPNRANRLLAATGAPTTAATAKATSSADLCAKASAPRLKIGDRAKISKPNSKDFPGAYLKTDSGQAEPVLRYLPLNTVVDVVDGPRCGDDKGYWYQIKYGDLTAWLAEVVGNDYALDPSTDPASKPISTTASSTLMCIRSSAAPTIQAAPAPKDAKSMRLVFATLDGNLAYTDNVGPSRIIANFNPPPLSVDLSPNGSAALVATYNGVYWVDVLTGNTILIADARTFKLSENAFASRVRWLPDGQSAAIEITDLQDNVTSYAIWRISLVDPASNFLATAGALPADSIKRSPAIDHAYIVSVSDISPFPQNANDDPPPILEFMARAGSEVDASQIVPPALTWAADSKGFYAFIPLSADAAPGVDPVGGHVWLIPANGGDPKSIGRLTKLKANEYAIPDSDGVNVLVGRATTWSIQEIKSGKVLRPLPALNLLFGWTPDGKGVIYNNKANEAKYLGIDGGTTSDYLPTVTDLYDIQWMADGTILYSARGKDGKLSFSVKRKGEDAKFMGIIASTEAFSARCWRIIRPLHKRRKPASNK